MNGLRLRLARLALALGLVSLLWACTAPLFPVPPPSATFTSELVSDGAGGMRTVWIAHGLKNANAALARFEIFDEARNAGVLVGAKDDGTYDAPPMEGTANDRVLIFYDTTQGERSPAACQLLQLGDTPIPCP